MKATVLSGPAKRSIWSVHRIVVLALAVTVVGLSSFVWFHSSVGYAQPGSIIAGADLRADMILILWLLAGAFTVAGSLVIAAAGRFTAKKRIVLPAAYAVAAAAVPLALIVVDRYV